uniref:Gametocyte specific factor 1 n=1 Tax=Falco tinnunculus TaxID=100819 RepID=A0A8C4U730_FALTI
MRLQSPSREPVARRAPAQAKLCPGGSGLPRTTRGGQNGGRRSPQRRRCPGNRPPAGGASPGEGAAVPQPRPRRPRAPPGRAAPWSWRMTPSYPEVAKELATCPFNARHLVPQADLSDHMMKCNDKGFIEQDVVNQSFRFQREQMNAVSTWQAPPCDEDWETESSEQSDSPFIWGTTSSGINSSSTTASEQRNCLPARVRAPESFPYAVSWKG